MISTKKYRLDKADTIIQDGVTLFRIIANRKFEILGGFVEADEKGGYIENEENLSQVGKCWIGSGAMAWGKAFVRGSARLIGEAKVYDYAYIGGSAVVGGSATVCGSACVQDDVIIRDNAVVRSRAIIEGDAHVEGDCEIIHDIRINTGVFRYFHTSEIRDIAWAISSYHGEALRYAISTNKLAAEVAVYSEAAKQRQKRAKNAATKKLWKDVAADFDQFVKNYVRNIEKMETTEEIFKNITIEPFSSDNHKCEYTSLLKTKNAEKLDSFAAFAAHKYQEKYARNKAYREKYKNANKDKDDERSEEGNS